MTTYTLDEVSLHKTPDDCWIVIRDHVYDVTGLIPIHPGGTTIIMQVAGEDATDYFTQLHRPEILDIFGSEYCIGRLQKAHI